MRAIAAVFCFIWAPLVLADDPKKSDEVTIKISVGGNEVTKPKEEPAGVVKNDEAAKLPFYFPPGVIQTNDPAKQYQEYLLYTTAMWNKTMHNPGRRYFVDPASIKVKTEMPSTSKSGFKGTMEIVLENHVRMADGRVRVTFFDEQFFITEEQLKVEIDDLLKLADEAAGLKFDYHKDWYDHIVTVRAIKLGLSKDDLLKQLNDKVDSGDVTYRELNSIPLPLEKSDFVPRQLRLGFAPDYEGVFGYAWLNAGLVSYNPLARVLDYLMGKPKILAHEFDHNCQKLQSYPLSEGFDVELMAMIPEGLWTESQLDMFRHHYLQELREICRVAFGFNFKEAQKRFIKFDSVGVLFVDEKEFADYMAKVRVIQQELLVFARDVAVPEFYSDPIWWAAFHDKMRNDNALWWVMMSLHYDPTILGGREASMRQAEIDKQVTLKIAKKNYKRSGDKGSGPSFYVPPALVKKYHELFSEEEREHLEAYFEKHPEALEEIMSIRMDRFSRVLQLIEQTKKEGR